MDNFLLIDKDTPRKPIRDTEARWGMGYDYYDWLCPSCKEFLTFEPNWRKIPKRCPECGQLLAELTAEEVSRS